MSEKTDVRCVGIILDGNRRWARERGLPTHEGHRAGAERLRDVVRWTRERGISHVAVYAFSSENWKRSEEEVSYMMLLLVEYAGKLLQKDGDPDKGKTRIRFIGDSARAPEHVQRAIRSVEENNDPNAVFTLWVCFSYGGRAEIAAAAEAMRREGKEITEDTLPAYLWSADMPDPDIVIRTGGEQRISNFLLWRISYSEFFFIKPYWPDFSEEIYDAILAEFGARERRHGV